MIEWVCTNNRSFSVVNDNELQYIIIGPNDENISVAHILYSAHSWEQIFDEVGL